MLGCCVRHRARSQVRRSLLNQFFDEAIAAYEKSIDLQPDLAESHNNLGKVFYEQSRWTQAETEYREAIRLNPDYVEARYGLGAVLYKQQQFGDAENQLREAIRLRPGCAAAHRVRKGELLCEVEDGCRLEIVIAVDEDPAVRVRPGQPVRLKARALPFRVLQAEVERVAAQAVPGDVRSHVNVYCRLQDPDGQLRSGMTGYARIECGRGCLAQVATQQFLRLLRGASMTPAAFTNGRCSGSAADVVLTTGRKWIGTRSRFASLSTRRSAAAAG